MQTQGLQKKKFIIERIGTQERERERERERREERDERDTDIKINRQAEKQRE